MRIKIFTLRLTNKEREELHKKSEEEGISLNAYIRKMLGLRPNIGVKFHPPRTKTQRTHLRSNRHGREETKSL